MKRKYKRSKKIFLFLIIINIFIIITTPFLGIRFGSLSEEVSEAIFITISFVLALVLFNFYSREVSKYKKLQEELEERLRETFKYIGSINLQLEELKRVFSISRYPENKKDIQALFAHTAERILGIVNVDWVLLKIVDIRNGNNLQEHFVPRGNKKIDKIKVENKKLLNGECSFGDCFVIKSDQENFNIKAFCILPHAKTSDNQTFLINSIINQLEMLFIIFNSLYYKKN